MQIFSFNNYLEYFISGLCEQFWRNVLFTLKGLWHCYYSNRSKNTELTHLCFHFLLAYNLLFDLAKCVLLSNGNKGFLPGSTRPSLTTYLIVCAQLLAVGREGEQPTGGVHHAANLQAVVVASLPGAQALTRTHHIAVAAFDAELQKNMFIFEQAQVAWKAWTSGKLNLSYAVQATSSC